ncbi:(S)-phenoxypropionate/alpha-ketoglutarate-dioxygenase [Aquicella siphonis]|uniref:(S)-phenoxypropionate/alpha-ketoglutarate-dioxygenase n=1 Tax=Aquicella siphonis TaxID=254247 RepID=A0A5E4PKT6_9COXI|nr:TauD/TfdA family dioxygenase [Aquicella siphonis]VVC77155.1 (S)-phenoxypropionate/alpha-ketoglutarate-dioxygenase [Aquicella siphonis]
MSLTISQLKPFGLDIFSGEGSPLQQVLSGSELCELVKKYHLVVFRKSKLENINTMIDYAKSMGNLLEWEFGTVMEMQEHVNPKNYLFTNGHVPFHWDGAFHKVPRYLLFYCVQAPLPGCGGETIFTNTQNIYASASREERHEWESLALTYHTEKLAHYGGCISVPLVDYHPDDGQKILRFAEPVPDTMLNPVHVSVNQLDAAESSRFIEEMSRRCHLDSNCYTHQWCEDDFLIADNYTLLHARRPYIKEAPRHLRRIQVV